MKKKLYDRREIDQRDAYNLILVSHNGQRFKITFLTKPLKNNFISEFSVHMCMFQKSFQVYAMAIESNSRRKCYHIVIPDNYNLVKFYWYVTRG